MRLLVSSYKAWRPEFGAPVVASLGLPRWIPEAKTWPRIRELTPRFEYFDAEEHVFEQAFLGQLDRYGTDAIRARLEEIAAEAGAETLIVCCFEASPFECHRGIWRSWWHEQTGEWADDIAELTG